MQEKVLVAMSGGVDSAMTAALLLDAGCEVFGATMQLYCGEKDENVCGSRKDADDAAALAATLGFPHEILQLSRDFDREVVRRFADGYLCGETPNPCIECNRYMKFGRLIALAKARGFDAIATGHYARVEKDKKSGRFLLKKAVDASKDQTYVLYHLTQDQLAHTRFPLGEYHKSEIRQMAAARGFSMASKPDSQDICFVPDGNYAAFLKRYTHTTIPNGNYLDINGKTLGIHKGHIHYTIGQRKGLGVAFGQPMYVIDKNAAGNTVTLGTKEQLPCTSLFADDVNWIAIDNLKAPIRVSVKTRYHQPETPATVSAVQGGVLVTLDTPQVAAPGQAVVFYDGDTVVGGGTIRRIRQKGCDK